MTWVSAEYQAQHIAVYKKFGKAKEYKCTDCGKRALDWSLEHGANPWDANNYWPRCRHCHLIYDAEAHRLSEESRRKIAVSLTGRKHSEESKDKMSKSRMGSKSSSAKLSEDEVLQIRSLVNGKYGQYPILAKQFGVSVITIKKIVYGKIWRHV